MARVNIDRRTSYEIDGYRYGYNQLSYVCPYPTNSLAGIDWIKGYEDGRGALLLMCQLSVEEYASKTPEQIRAEWGL